ncbi:MAG: hypothetical protein WBP13_01120 [Methylophilaceae bacterium]
MKIIISLFSLLLAACVSTDSLQSNGDFGDHYVVTGKSYAQIWHAATIAMSTDMDIVESHKPSGIIKSKVVNGTAGKVVGFFIQPTDENAPRYKINIVSKKPFQSSDFDKGGEPSVWEDFKQALTKSEH